MLFFFVNVVATTTPTILNAKVSNKYVIFFCTQVFSSFELWQVSTKRKIMKRLILFLVLVLHSIRFYNDYRSASALTNVAAESTYFSPNRYFQLEKGIPLWLFVCLHQSNFVIFLIANFCLMTENEIFADDEWSLLRRSKGDRRGWVKI